jgi:uncharacterized membrane protein YfcA
MLLEVATTAGALTGAFLAGRIGGGVLYIVFACVMIYTALSMLRFNHDGGRTDHISDRLADRLTLHGSYRDDSEGTEVKYRVRRTRVGLALSYAAGLISGLLGVGGGVIKVPAMNLVMGMPLKVATATSNFMIGVTGAASAGVYFSRGDVNPFITGPVAVGVVLGSTIGSRILSRIHSSLLRISFVLLLVWVAIQMLLKGVR